MSHRWRRLLLAALATATLPVLAACGENEAGTPTRTPTTAARGTSTSTPKATASPGAGVTSTSTASPVQTPPVAVTSPPGTATAMPSTTATPQPTPLPPDRREERAPIERVDVVRVAGGYVARITSGLPSGCARYYRASVTQSGTVLTVEVLNSMPVGAVACTAIYGMITNDVPLGALTPGTAYTLDVNGTRQTFVAE